MKEVRFFNINFEISELVFRPYKQTEYLVEEGIKLNPKTICDVGTGCGNIIVSLLKNLPEANGLATDIQYEALQSAYRNINLHGLSDRARTLHSNLLDNVNGRFDLICFNPPYHSLDMYNALPENIMELWPKEALTDGDQGWTIVAEFLKQVKKNLNPEGKVLIEMYSFYIDHIAGLVNKIEVIDTDEDNIKIVRAEL